MHEIHAILQELSRERVTGANATMLEGRLRTRHGAGKQHAVRAVRALRIQRAHGGRVRKIHEHAPQRRGVSWRCLAGHPGRDAMTLAVAAAYRAALVWSAGCRQLVALPREGMAMEIDAGDSVVRKAIRQLERIKKSLAGLGVQCLEVGLDVFGAGVGVAQNGTDFVMLSVAGPADSVLNITAGLLKDISHERPKVLELCNSFTKGNSACPVYLHDAPDGWDIHMQQRFLVDMLIGEPWFFRSCVEDLSLVARSARSKFHAAGICGQPYMWSGADARRLLVRSLV